MEMKFYKEKVQDLMREKQYSKNKLATLTGLSHTAVSSWVTGRRVPRDYNVVLLAKALKVSVNEISDMEEVEDISAELSGYFQGWGASFDKNKKELDDPCIRAINEIENIKVEQYRLRTVVRAFMSTTHSMLYVKNYQGEYIVANESYLKAIGLDININIIGKIDKDIMSQKVSETNNTQDMSIINTGKTEIKKLIKFPFPHNKIKWCVMTKVPLRDNRLNIVGMAASFTDITEERSLRRQDEMLKEVIRQSKAAVGIVSIVSGRRKFVYANDALLEIIGYTREDFNKNFSCWFMNIAENDRERVQEFLDNFLLPERTISFNYQYPNTGKIKYLTIKSSSVKDSNLTYNCIYDETEKAEREREKEKLLACFELLADFIDTIDTAVFIGEYEDTTIDLVEYLYRDEKTYKYIDDTEKWEDILDPEQRTELLELAKNKKYPKTMRYNIIKKNCGICTIEEKTWVKEVNGKKYFFSAVKDIKKQDKVEVLYFDALGL